MSFSEINWPSTPENGQVYKSSFGRIWVWDGCAWTATCCPPVVCDPYRDGIVFKIGISFENEGDFDSFIFFSGKYIEYSESPTWIAYMGNIPFLNLFRTIDGWILKDLDGLFVSSLNQDVDIPIGIWEPSESISSFETYCGSGFPTYCMLATVNGEEFIVNFIPVYLSNGEILLYTSLSIISIIRDEENNKWNLVSFEGSEPVIHSEFVGPKETPPVGTWTSPVGSPEIFTAQMFQHPNQNCPCETQIGGITLITNINTDLGSVNIFGYFEWNGIEYYTMTDPELTIQYSSETYTFSLSGDAVATSNSIFGPWDIDPDYAQILNSIESVCGYFTNSSMCLTVYDGENTSVYSLDRYEFSPTDILYTNDLDDIQVSFDPDNDQWVISMPSTSTTIGTTPGTSMGPWNGGILISDVSPYEITIEEKFCVTSP